MKNSLHLSALTLGLFLSGNLFAGAMGPVVADTSGLQLTLGAFASHQGDSQHINIATLVGDDFTVRSQNDFGGLIGLGYFWSGLNNYLAFPLAIGVDAFYLSPTTVKGTVVQETVFPNLSYKYDISHVPVYAMARTQFASYFPINLDLGIGPNFMKTKSFSESSLDGITIPDNHIFSGETKATFSATAGISATIAQIYDSTLDFGYRFYYLGEGELESGNSQVLNDLQTGHVYANALFFNLNF